jgi:hypothetical protein
MKKTKISLKRVLNMYEIENLKNIPDHARVTSELAEKTVEKIINALTVKKGISETVAVALIAGLVQNGGTNKGAGNSAKFTLGDQTLSAQELVNYIKKEQTNGTIRQLARAIADEIVEVSLALSIEGDLANQMRYDYPDITQEEAVWCSNFQTTNMNCPTRVRVWLVDNYRSRFNR